MTTVTIRENAHPDLDAGHPRGNDVLRDIVNGFRASQALFVVAELGIADHLAHSPCDAHRLASLTGTNPDALKRIIRALCVLEVFAELPDGKFSLAGPGHLLRTDVPGSYRAAVRLLTGATRLRCWSSLLETVRTGVDAAERELGMQIFDYYAAHPGELKIHDDAMRALSANATALANVIDVGAARVVADVGGGTGELLAAVLATHDGLNGILFDLPDVVKHAPDILRQKGVADRCAIEGGSFFDRVPRADLYLLKQVLHDWDDERAIAILRCCRRLMPETARLAVIERRMPERAEAGVSRDPFMTDLEMLVMTPGGRERTESEMVAIFDKAGLRHVRTVPTASTLSVYEAQPL